MFFVHNPWLNVTCKLRKQKVNNKLLWSLLTGSDHNSILKSRLPACFFFLILLSYPFLRSNPDPTLIFVMSFMLQSIHYWNKHYIRLTWQRAALMFKVLDLTINDCNFILFFCLLVFFSSVHQYKTEGLLPSESCQLIWVGGSFNCFTARFH